MTQFMCWVVLPLVLALVSLGCGLLLERAAGLRLAEGLLIPVGLAVVVVVAEILTKSGTTAKFTTPVVVVLALAGLVVARPWRVRPRLGAWPLIAAGAVYLAYLAPVLLSGEPTFTGYIKLDDTAYWMAMTDGVLSFGHDLSHLAPSTYEYELHFYLTGGEPVGAMLPWGIGHQLVGEDIAWVFQPYLAFLGAMLALAAWAIVAPLVRSRALRALIVFVAAQAALIYGYSLWGGIKEVAAASLLALSVACAITAFQGEARIRAFLPLAAACFAMLGVLGWGGAVWLAATLVVVGLAAARTWVKRSSRLQLAGLATLALVLAVGLVLGAQHFVNINRHLTSGSQLGLLTHRLSWLQLFGIWPAGDFRVDPPNSPTVTHILIALVIVMAAAGLVATGRRRSWAPALYLLGAGVGCLLVSLKGSPWVQGKAFATAAPATVLMGLLGAATLLDSRRGSSLSSSAPGATEEAARDGKRVARAGPATHGGRRAAQGGVRAAQGGRRAARGGMRGRRATPAVAGAATVVGRLGVALGERRLRASALLIGRRAPGLLVGRRVLAAIGRAATRRAPTLLVGRRIFAAVGGVAIIGGVVWSNVLAYHDVTLAPYGQLTELEQIGQRFAGQGPTLLNEYEPYGPGHFLRATDPEAPSDVRHRLIPLRNGYALPSGFYADLDLFKISALLVYRTIVIPTAPVASRPPAPYNLVYNGRRYQVWQRPLTPSRPVLDGIPLGNRFDPTAIPACGDVLRLAGEAGAGGLLAAVARPAPSVMTVPSQLPTGDTRAAFAVTTPGLYEIWLKGAFVRRLSVSVDGVSVGSAREVLNETGDWAPLGRAIRLDAGAHHVTLSYGDAELAPGSGGAGRQGPVFPVLGLAAARVMGDFPVTYVNPAQARSLCGKPWDWIEALGA